MRYADSWRISHHKSPEIRRNYAATLYDATRVSSATQLISSLDTEHAETMTYVDPDVSLIEIADWSVVMG